MEKVISFVIMNVATSAILGIICLIFLYFVITSINQKYYMFDGFWEKFGMLVMLILFLMFLWCGVQIAPTLNLSVDGSCIVCALAVIYLLISCKVTDNEIWDIL